MTSRTYYLLHVVAYLIFLIVSVGLLVAFVLSLPLIFAVLAADSSGELATFDDTPPPIKELLKRSETEVWLLKDYGGSKDRALYVVTDPPGNLRRVIHKSRSDRRVHWEGDSDTGWWGWSMERNPDGSLHLERFCKSYREVRRHRQLNGLPIGYSSTRTTDLVIHNGFWEESSHMRTYADYGLYPTINPIYIPLVESYECGEAKRVSP